MKITRKKENRIILLASLLLLLLLTVLLGVHDESGDDNMMQLYISSCDGTASDLHIWTGALWTALTCFLQTNVGFFAWHYLLQVILLFVSVGFAVQWFLETVNLGRILRWMIPLTFVWIMYFQTVYLFNFTRTAELLLSVGILLASQNRKILPSILFFFAGVLRFSTIYLALGYWGAAIFAIFYFKKQETPESETVEKIKQTAWIVLPIIVCLVANGLCSVLRSADIGWKTAYEYNDAASRVVDYGLIDYSENKDQYSAAGLSENDVTFLTGRLAGSDTDVFSRERLTDISDRFTAQNFTGNLGGKLVRFAKNFVKTFFINPVGQIALLAFAFILLFGSKKEKIYTLLLFAGSCAYEILFVVIGRSPDRVLFGIASFFFFSMLPILARSETSESRNFKLEEPLLKAAPILLVALILVVPIECYRDVSVQNMEEFEYIEEHPDQFICYFGLDESASVHNILLMNDYWQTGNTFRLSLFSITPHESEKLERFDVANPYKDSINSEFIRIMCSEKSRPILETYLKEHYDEDARMVVETELEKLNVYKVTVS